MRDIGMVQRWIVTSVAREALVWEGLADGQIGRRGFRGSAIGRIPVVIRVVGGSRGMGRISGCGAGILRSVKGLRLWEYGYPVS